MIELFKHMKLPYKRIILLFFAVIFCLNLTTDISYAGDNNGNGGSYEQSSGEEPEGCDSPAKVREHFLATCFICDVVVSLTREFINVGSYTYGMVKELANQILLIGLILWIPFYIMKQVSSFVAVEPSTMVKDLSVLFFKVGFAYSVIAVVSISEIIDFLITPFVTLGLDYGKGMMQYLMSNEDAAKIKELTEKNSQYYVAGGIMPKHLTSAMLEFLNYLHYTITEHLVIGNSLMCYATGPGARSFKVVIKLMDFWIFLSGLLIYALGALVLIAAGYYFLDVSYKIGFVIMFMPIFIALWPFNMTKKYITKAMGSIFMAAAIFAFFAVLSCLSLSMVNQSIGELKVVVDAIAEDKAEVLKQRFDGTSIWFLILAFCLMMAFQMIGKCKEFAGDFFSDGLFGNPASKDVIGDKMKQMTESGYNAAVKKPLNFASDVAKTQSKKGMQKLGNKIKSSFSTGDKGEGSGKGGGKGGTKAASKAAGKAAGQAAEKGMQAGGKGAGMAIGGALGGLVDVLSLGATGGAGAKTGAKLGGKAGEAVGKFAGKISKKAVEKGVEKGVDAAGEVAKKGTQAASDTVKDTKKDNG